MNLLQNKYGSDNNDKRTHHNLSRIMTNARKLTHVFRDPFVAAEDEDEIYNLLTVEVMTEKVYETSWNDTILDTNVTTDSPNTRQRDDIVSGTKS